MWNKRKLFWSQISFAGLEGFNKALPSAVAGCLHGTDGKMLHQGQDRWDSCADCAVLIQMQFLAPKAFVASHHGFQVVSTSYICRVCTYLKIFSVQTKIS